MIEREFDSEGNALVYSVLANLWENALKLSTRFVYREFFIKAEAQDFVYMHKPEIATLQVFVHRDKYRQGYTYGRVSTKLIYQYER